jgi:hypothetical protein
VAESENVYVKIGERGRLLERTAEREIDHATLRARGWKLKGSKNAPTRKDETVTKPAEADPTAAVPTSMQAQTAGADTGTTTATTAKSTSATGAAADAKSQNAAGR